jgi:hypothetical protein
LYLVTSLSFFLNKYEYYQIFIYLLNISLLVQKRKPCELFGTLWTYFESVNMFLNHLDIISWKHFKSSDIYFELEGYFFKHCEHFLTLGILFEPHKHFVNRSILFLTFSSHTQLLQKL